MFAGLDDIDWTTLEHAYGPATDVPGQLRDLVAGDEAQAKAIIRTFFSNIYHQGTVYTATAPAVPFLVEALDRIEPPHQASVLVLLAHVAQGHGYLDVHQHMSHLGGPLRAGFDDPEATLAEERRIVRDATLAVYAQWDQIAERLAHADLSVRNAALFALAVLGQNDASDVALQEAAAPYLGVRPEGSDPGELAAQVELAAGRVIDTASDAVTRAGARAALVSIRRTDHPALRLDALPEGAEPIERFVALVAQTTGAEATLPDALAPEIARLVQDFDALDQAVRADHWHWDYRPRTWLPNLAARLSNPAIDSVAADLVPLLSHAGLSYDPILYLVLGKEMPRIPDDPCALSPGRRLLAQALVDLPETPNFWIWAAKNGNASREFKRRDIPRDREVWRRWLNPRPSWIRSILGGRA